MLASYRYCVCSRTGPTIAHSWMSGKDKLCVKKESRLFIRTTSVTTKEWGEEKRNARGEEQWAAGGLSDNAAVDIELEPQRLGLLPRA